jgi:hypothetical protein
MRAAVAKEEMDDGQSQSYQQRDLTISVTPEVWRKLERLFALLHYNAGHTAIFGLTFDGDDADDFKIDPRPSEALRNFDYAAVRASRFAAYRAGPHVCLVIGALRAMCGRITPTRSNLESIAAEIDVDPMNYRGYPLVEPRYNIAPTSVLPILTLVNGQREISPMTWGITLGPKTELGDQPAYRDRGDPRGLSEASMRRDHRRLLRMDGRAGAY